MTKVLITGQSGLIGTRLSKLLIEKGYEVVGLSRSPKGSSQFHWDIESGKIDPAALQNVSAIIHLAGEGIADKKWTTDRKKEIIDSRTKSVELLHQAALDSGTKLAAFISASGVSYYGTATTEAIYKEEDASGNDFAAQCCVLWEAAADKFASNTRVVKLRTGIVLTRKGGALEKILPPIKAGIGSRLGNGKQYMPWIHIEDICAMYLWALENEKVAGTYNAVAPEHVTNHTLMKQLAQTLRRPFFFPAVPAFAIKWLFGDRASLILEGSRISAKKVETAGYSFRFKKLDEALRNLFL